MNRLTKHQTIAQIRKILCITFFAKAEGEERDLLNHQNEKNRIVQSKEEKRRQQCYSCDMTSETRARAHLESLLI